MAYDFDNMIENLKGNTIPYVDAQSRLQLNKYQKEKKLK